MATQASGAHEKVKLKGPSCYPGQGILIRAVEGGMSEGNAKWLQM